MKVREQAANRIDIESYLRKWDEVGEVKGVNMGGFGGGYDLAIQSLTMELLRWLLESDVAMAPLESKGDRDELSRRMDQVVTECDKQPWAGFSGAQVGAAQTVAYQFWVYGFERMMNKALLECPERIEVFKNPAVKSEEVTA